MSKYTLYKVVHIQDWPEPYMYIYTYGIFGREMTYYTVIYGVLCTIYTVLTNPTHRLTLLKAGLRGQSHNPPDPHLSFCFLG